MLKDQRIRQQDLQIDSLQKNTDSLQQMVQGRDAQEADQMVDSLHSKVESLEMVIEEMQAKVFQNTLDSLDNQNTKDLEIQFKMAKNENNLLSQ